MTDYGTNMGNGAIITLEQGWNEEIKVIALDPLEVRLAGIRIIFFALLIVISNSCNH